ncbi:MAG: hypothetical protein JSU65_09330 [Candidatus Zixiibacteriota bacterium]|nr:MAG: hypothetical protein JSU65_09330 [candidate division Zixibacteria bacterium]
MKKVRLSVLAVMVIAVMCGGYSFGSDASAAQEWAFEMEKVWEIQHIGEDKLLRPAEPRVADDGTLYFHDFERHLSYIIDGDGKLVSAFAPRGSGEGEVSMYINCFTAGGHVVVCAMDKLHFFTKQGKFVKAVSNNPFVRFPLAFKNENEFWVAPGALGDAPEGSAVVTHVNLATGEETTVHEFARSEVEKRPTGGGVVVGLTPQIKMGFDSKSDRVYFGKNSDTVVYRLAGNDGKVESFSFTGVRHPVTETDKRNHFARFNVPEERLVTMIGVLPDQMAYYHRIEIIDGLVYLLSTRRIGDGQTGLDVNVFSPDGQHRYHGRIDVEDGWHISGPDNLQLARGSVYAVQQNDAGVKKIAKYKVDLPQ